MSGLPSLSVVGPLSQASSASHPWVPGVRLAKAQHPAAAVKAGVRAEPGKCLKAPSQAWSPKHSLPRPTQGNPDSGFPSCPTPKQSWASPLRGRIGLSECKRLEEGVCPTEPAFLHCPLEPSPAAVLLVSREGQRRVCGVL